MARSLYGLLGLSPRADEGEIKAAFRKLAKQFHPDLHAGDKGAEQRFKEINAAYATLSDPTARAQYDANLSQERSLKRQRLRNLAAITATSFALTVTIVSSAIVWREHGNGLLLSAGDQQQMGPAAQRNHLEDGSTSVEVTLAAGQSIIALPSTEPLAKAATAAVRQSIEAARVGMTATVVSGTAGSPGGRRAEPDGGRNGEKVVHAEAASQEVERREGRVGSTFSRLPPPDTASWASYRNVRFGFSLRYPADIFVANSEQSDDNVRRFRSQDGRAILQVFATPNLAGRTAAQYRAALIQERYGKAAIDYAPLRDTWFVLSGAVGDGIFYERVTFSCDRRLFHGWRLVFPSSERVLYEAVIEEMHRHYRHSNGPGARCGVVKPQVTGGTKSGSGGSPL